MASDPEPSATTAPFTLGSAPTPPSSRRIVRARRPPRRRASGQGSTAAASASGAAAATIGAFQPVPASRSVARNDARSIWSDSSSSSSSSSSEETMPSLSNRNDTSSEEDSSSGSEDIDWSEVDTACNESSLGDDASEISTSSSESNAGNVGSRLSAEDTFRLAESALVFGSATPPSEEFAGSTFNVVSPLSVENRFTGLEDDEDSTSSLPSLDDIAQGNLNNVSRGPTQTKTNQKRTKTKKSKKKTNKAKSDDIDPSLPICSICIEPDQPSSKWNKLVILPCCGSALSPEGTPKELNYSTRFCSGCILKLVKVNLDKDRNEYSPWDNEMHAYPQSVFYEGNPMLSEEGEIIECPRCRDLISVKCTLSRDYNDGGSECDCSECRMERRKDQLSLGRVRSIRITEPSFASKLNFVGRKRGIAQLLWRMAYLPRDIITLEGLGGARESARVSKLTGWGVLKKNGDVYSLKEDDQGVLLKLFEIQKVVSSEEYREEDDRDWKMFQPFMACFVWAIWDRFKKLQLGRAIRMLNHMGVLQHYFAQRLPSLPLNPPQSMAVAGLNIFCLCVFLRLSLSLVINGSLFFGGISVVCRILRFSAKQTDKMKGDSILACLIIVMGAFFTHKLLSFTRYESLVWNRVIWVAEILKNVVL